MNVFFTDDKQHVVVDDTIYPIDIFVTFYGEDALPQGNVEEQQKFCTDYYDTFLKLLDDLGKFAHSYKLLKNVEAGDTPQVNQVRDKYYGNNAKLAKEVQKRKDRCWKSVISLNEESQKVGFPPMDHDSQRNLLNFLYQKKRRTYFRRRIRQFKEKGEILSIREFYNMCISAQGPR